MEVTRITPSETSVIPKTAVNDTSWALYGTHETMKNDGSKDEKNSQGLHLEGNKITQSETICISESEVNNTACPPDETQETNVRKHMNKDHGSTTNTKKKKSNNCFKIVIPIIVVVFFLIILSFALVSFVVENLQDNSGVTINITTNESDITEKINKHINSTEHNLIVSSSKQTTEYSSSSQLASTSTQMITSVSNKIYKTTPTKNRTPKDSKRENANSRKCVNEMWYKSDRSTFPLERSTSKY